jgi:hypothetical protein
MFVLTRTESLKLSVAVWQAGSHKLGIVKVPPRRLAGLGHRNPTVINRFNPFLGAPNPSQLPPQILLPVLRNLMAQRLSLTPSDRSHEMVENLLQSSSISSSRPRSLTSTATHRGSLGVEDSRSHRQFLGRRDTRRDDELKLLLSLLPLWSESGVPRTGISNTTLGDNLSSSPDSPVFLISLWKGWNITLSLSLLELSVLESQCRQQMGRGESGDMKPCRRLSLIAVYKRAGAGFTGL